MYANECNECRTISLLSHASKIIIKALQQRIEAKVSTIHTLGEDQFGEMRKKHKRSSWFKDSDREMYGAWQRPSSLFCGLSEVGDVIRKH